MMDVLIVEDEQIPALECQEILKDNGYDVVGTHASFEDARSDVDDADVVLMDIRLNGKLSGIEAARELKDRDITVIYVTAHSDTDTLHRAQETYPAGYIVKPYTEEELLTAIETAESSP